MKEWKNAGRISRWSNEERRGGRLQRKGTQEFKRKKTHTKQGRPTPPRTDDQVSPHKQKAACSLPPSAETSSKIWPDFRRGRQNWQQSLARSKLTFPIRKPTPLRPPPHAAKSATVDFPQRKCPNSSQRLIGIAKKKKRKQKGQR